MILDNIAWCIHEISGISSFSSVVRDLEQEFNLVFEEVYQAMSDVKSSDFYDSWLLRGDNPVRYSSYKSQRRIDNKDWVTEWSEYDLNDDPDAVSARRNQCACELYYRYHFDQDVRKKGDEIMEFICPEKMAKVIEYLQLMMLEKLRRAKIGIETNPTSNRRIGGFPFYHDLPVFKFVPSFISEHEISVSVNTDDRGIFTTSLEREYALLAGALYKSRKRFDSQAMVEICEWLDRIRINGWKQRFVNYV